MSKAKSPDKEVVISIRCSQEYKAKLLEAAKQKDMSVSEYVIFCIDNVEIYAAPLVVGVDPGVEADEEVYLLSRNNNLHVLQNDRLIPITSAKKLRKPKKPVKHTCDPTAFLCKEGLCVGPSE